MNCSRENPVFVFVNLTESGNDEQAKERILDSLRTSDVPIDPASVWIAVDANDAGASGDAPGTGTPWTVYSDRPAVQVANFAFASAARSGADLLILNGSSLPGTAALRALGRCLATDPHIGFAVPRVEGFMEQLIHKLDPEHGDPDIDLIPRSVIDSLPPHYMMRDFTGPCLLLPAKVVREFKQLELGFETLQGSIRELMARARRVGFRSAVVNRAFVEAGQGPGGSAGDDAGARDLARLYGLYPEQAQVDENQRSLPVYEHECLLGRAGSSSAALRKSLVIDASDLGAIHNGTSQASLGILQGLHDQTRGWRVMLLVPPEGAKFHDMERRFPDFEFEWPAPQSRFTAAFRLSQSWSVHDLLRLHRMALFNFVFMLDTILDDIQQGAPVGLEQAWGFAARTADGLVYISRYTRNRMRERFAVSSSVEERVSHLSMDPNDYCTGDRKSAGEDFVYVVGNHYPHKWMDTTVRDLASAFPFLKLKTLGYENPAIAQLEGFASGHLPQEQVDRLYADAKAIVFPSMYEGFGFPVIKGLAHGRTVIARQSELLDELAGIYRGPGRLVQFSSSQELIEALGCVLHGLPLEAVQLGANLGSSEASLSWPDVAARILEFIIERAEKPDSSNWERREAEFAAMDAFAAGR